MKKLTATILALAIVLSMTACGSRKVDENTEAVDNQQVEETLQTPEPEATDEPNKKETAKPSATVKPTEKPSEQPTAKPTEKPTEQPVATPKPQEQPKTVGQKLLADFNAKAASTSSTQALAESIVSNPVIMFSAATMPVEPGLLSGFGNTEIKGFKEGTMFGPVIGSVPFVGYVFLLEDGTDAKDFISTLKSAADLRWNICVEADEMVAGHVGNKVFFVMSPKEFTEE